MSLITCGQTCHQNKTCLILIPSTCICSAIFLSDNPSRYSLVVTPAPRCIRCHQKEYILVLEPGIWRVYDSHVMFVANINIPNMAWRKYVFKLSAGSAPAQGPSPPSLHSRQVRWRCMPTCPHMDWSHFTCNKLAGNVPLIAADTGRRPRRRDIIWRGRQRQRKVDGWLHKRSWVRLHQWSGK
jgi:hypothetical protein